MTTLYIYESGQCRHDEFVHKFTCPRDEFIDALEACGGCGDTLETQLLDAPFHMHVETALFACLNSDERQGPTYKDVLRKLRRDEPVCVPTDESEIGIATSPSEAITITLPGGSDIWEDGYID